MSLVQPTSTEGEDVKRRWPLLVRLLTAYMSTGPDRAARAIVKARSGAALYRGLIRDAFKARATMRKLRAFK